MNSDGGKPTDDAETEDRVPAAEDARRRALREKVAALKPKPVETAAGRQTGGLSGIGQALRVGSEFVAGVIVGFVIGYTIDSLFGTRPWGMIVFLLLGFAAGTLNVMRATGVVAERFPPEGGDGKGKG